MATAEEKIELLSAALNEARATIAEQTEILDRISAPPLGHATLLAEHGDSITIVQNGSLIDVLRPKNIKLSAGDAVLVGESRQIVSKAHSLPVGDVATVVSAASPGGLYEISAGGGGRAVLAAHSCPELRQGDRVIMDSSGHIILGRLESARERFVVNSERDVEWADIGGNDEAKREMIEAIELPLTNPGLFAHYRRRPTKGILLYGPPGCGKTMLGKAAATAIARQTGGESGFMYMKGPEVLDPYVGATEAAIRSAFERARQHKVKHGTQAVLFIDEAEALLGRRGDRHAHMEKTIVPTFLAEMDGLEESGCLVILATNRPDQLDSAITRDGRIDRKVCVSRPDRDGAESIFNLYLKDTPLAGEYCHDAAAADASSALFDGQMELYRVSFSDGAEQAFTLANLASGALIAGVCEQAASLALRRDIDNNAHAPTGVTQDDLLQSVRAVFTQNRDVDHRDALMAFAGNREIVNIRSI